MKEIKRYVSRNWIWIVTGLILTEVSVKIAYAERGYIAYGGEWLIFPLVLMIVEMVRSIGKTVWYLLRTEDDYEPTRDKGNCD